MQVKSNILGKKWQNFIIYFDKAACLSNLAIRFQRKRQKMLKLEVLISGFPVMTIVIYFSKKTSFLQKLKGKLNNIVNSVNRVHISITTKQIKSPMQLDVT